MEKSETFLRYQWTSIWLGLGTLLGIIFVWWFGARYSLNLGLLLLWCMAYLAIGGLMGFIFSVPKIISDTGSAPPPSTTATTTGTPPAGGSATTPTTTMATASAKVRYQENTNLTQISDWLTKILIGAGLVELKEIPKFIYHVAQVTGRGISTKVYLTDAATTSCAAIILYFVTWGFISGYLVMKLVLSEQFANLDLHEG